MPLPIAAGAAFVLPMAGQIVRKFYSRLAASRAGAVTITAVQKGATPALLTGLTINEIIEAVREDAPNSDESALNETAHTVARMLGLDGSEVLWPVHRRGDNQGMPIEPLYFTMDLTNGRAWYSSKYHSRKSVNAGFRRGVRSGDRRARRDMVQTKDIAA